MDAIFALSQVERANHLQLLVQSFGSTYICLWSYNNPSNFLFFWDGCFEEETNQASSSSGSLARRLFDEYRRELFFVVYDRVPGLAFKNNRPYIELNESNLQTMAAVDVQRQFYQAARIKTAVFMGCRSGEIELGWSNATQITDMEDRMKNWFPEDFLLSPQLTTTDQLYHPVDPSRTCSSSSSLKSQSLDSPESSPLFNIINPTTSHLGPPPTTQVLDPFQSNIPITCSTTTSIQSSLQLPFLPLNISPHQQGMGDFALTGLPRQQIEDAALTRAILTVLSSSNYNSSSSSSSSPSVTQKASAFKKYPSHLGPNLPARANLRRQNMLKRAITYYRSLSIVRREHMILNRPTSTQLHHMISERKRREKINESFQALRSLLPPEAKKDKASVLTRTRDYLASLKAQVSELSERNQQLESQLLITAPKAREAAPPPAAAAADRERVDEARNERVVVRVTHLPESTSEQRIVELQVSVRGDCPVLDMAIRILGFLRRDNHASLISMEAASEAIDSASFSGLTFRLKIEGKGWDESAFQEAVKRVVADLAH